jgi:hypothetical protein
MQDFADRAEAHEWTLRRMREMTGRLTEVAYQRAMEASAGDGEEAARWMLVFDRMARGLRLTLALEARLHRERRWDADEIAREASGARHEPRWRKAAQATDAEPCESDRERDDDGLPADAPISVRIERLKTIIEGAGVPEPAQPPYRAEFDVLTTLRAKRARRAGVHPAPDEPWDILTDAERAADDPPWRESG